MKKIWVVVMILLLSGCIIAQTTNQLRSYKIGISGFPIIVIQLMPGFGPTAIIPPHVQLLLRLNHSLALNIKGGYPNVLTAGIRCYSKQNAIKGFYLGTHLMVYREIIHSDEYKLGAGIDIGNTFIFWKIVMIDISLRCTYKEPPYTNGGVTALYSSLHFFDSENGLEISFPISIGFAF